ncbi:hypothetical protein OSB04_004999 [Centaurea solstitialis]|uniref:AIG1-type G domain-containing protein n=1 Tax=Centaurea solstitialis TaxID=347529 RepID=A0AA38TGY6_9ASTR|nr:hypothetical protein OSB04_004999 [Centaurea solstitialis]
MIVVFTCGDELEKDDNTLEAFICEFLKDLSLPKSHFALQSDCLPSLVCSYILCIMGGCDGRTLVLVGKTGNGKSATGNSILGKKVFESKRSICGVTRTCELKSVELEDGQMLNVIDTPGLFDSSIDDETIGKEIVNCVKMAVDGIHAVLIVYSVLDRFSDEEKAAISILRGLFGRKICDYMIVVFTCGDELEEEDMTLEEFICECPQALKVGRLGQLSS